jgi:hypothetical protein
MNLASGSVSFDMILLRFENDLFFVLFFFFGGMNEDVSTDGKWCYIVFWVVGKEKTRWSLLKKRLIAACPTCSSASGISYYCSNLQPSKPPDVFLLKFSCNDRKGLLHGNFSLLNFNSYFFFFSEGEFQLSLLCVCS